MDLTSSYQSESPREPQIYSKPTMNILQTNHKLNTTKLYQLLKGTWTLTAIQNKRGTWYHPVNPITDLKTTTIEALKETHNQKQETTQGQNTYSPIPTSQACLILFSTKPTTLRKR